MIANISELKELVTWAKSQKLKSLQVGEISFEFSELAHLETVTDISVSAPNLAVPPTSQKLPDGNAELTEEEALLYWSTR